MNRIAAHSRGTAIALAGLWLTFSAVASAQTKHEAEVEHIRPHGSRPEVQKNADIAQVQKRIVDQTNVFRKMHGREPVQVNSRLTETAQYFAHYMARTDKYGHTADGSRPSQRAEDHGYNYCVIEENIAYEYSSIGLDTQELAKKLVHGWENSPPHRENMLNPDVIETGVAVAQSAKTGYYYAVQMFGRPRSKAIEFEITNESQTTVHYKVGDRSYVLPPRYTRTHERCRPGDLSLQLPAADSETQTRILHPTNGEHFTIQGSPGSFRVTTQK